MDKQSIHKANQKRWEASADNWAAAADSRGIWKKCHLDPSLEFCEKTLGYFKSIANNKVAVLGSGDNQAVIALAGMSAQVTSIDISQNQLDHAKARAQQLGLEISFIQQDVTNLNKIQDQQFDFVYTGGHVAVWVADLQKYYSEAVRILKPGGLLVIEEYHPFRRIWKSSKTDLKVGYNYFDRGPFHFKYSDNVLHPDKGDFDSYEFHWTISDFCNAIIQAGCTILEVYEYGDSYVDWEEAPVNGLPNILSIYGKKLD